MEIGYERNSRIAKAPTEIPEYTPVLHCNFIRKLGGNSYVKRRMKSRGRRVRQAIQYEIRGWIHSEVTITVDFTWYVSNNRFNWRWEGFIYLGGLLNHVGRTLGEGLVF